MAYVEFHHYTDTCGRDAILKSGYILEKPAGHRHAHFGPGAYGTSLAPSEGLRKIAENNWKNHWMSNINNGKMDWAIVVDIPFRFVMEYGADEGRDILVYNGRLYLDDYCYDVVRGPTF
ncbi:hypothetical protein V1264_011486 [Littorina saxatilis]|uniref:Tox-ART-HYD1 domain-containing protein n=1 Tax=Littorina saxatilis TaxID=31220 RepID=A0AAN9GL02_9CAEN